MTLLTYDEQEKMALLMAKDKNFHQLITAIKEDYHLTLSQISHEIRNPLTYMDSSIQWIQKLHPEVENFEFWEQMKHDLQYLKVLLDDISAFNNGEQLTISRIDPKEFAFDLKDTLLPELLDKHIPLLMKLDDTYPDFYGDPIRLKQTFINLIKNSIESITGRELQNHYRIEGRGEGTYRPSFGYGAHCGGTGREQKKGKSSRPSEAGKERLVRRVDPALCGKSQ